MSFRFVPILRFCVGVVSFIPAFAHGFSPYLLFCFACYFYNLFKPLFQALLPLWKSFPRPLVLVIYCCVINLPILMAENNNYHLLPLMISVDFRIQEWLT